MDSITQATLGAAVGEAFLGKKVGYRAAAWGAVLGTVPDLDIILNPFVDTVIELRAHRSFTHSITFAVLLSPVFGWLIDRFHSDLEIGWKPWTKLAFFAFLTHTLIDITTTYGTQFLFPFTDTPYTTDSVFIIDPLYTLPLLIGLIVSLFMKRSATVRKVSNFTGLVLSSLYLIWGLGIKVHVHSVFSASFENQYAYYEKLKTTPNGPTTFLWTGYAVKNDTLYNAVYSIFDSSKNLDFRSIPRRTHLIEEIKDDRAINTLLWFSRGYYIVDEDGDNLIFTDLRFGRDDFWLTDEGDFIWKNEIIFNEAGEAYTFDLSIPAFDTRTQNLSRFWNRIWGE
jgi:inner membrane protein